MLLLLILVGAFVGMIRAYLIALEPAATFAGLLYPFYDRIRLALRDRAVPASIITITVCGLAVGLPLAGLAGMVAGSYPVRRNSPAAR